MAGDERVGGDRVCNLLPLRKHNVNDLRLVLRDYEFQ